MNYREDSFLKQNFLSKIHYNKEENILLSLLQLSFNLPSHKRPGNPPKYNIANPLLKILGPPAKHIAEKGGHCGRRSRLLINLLHKKNIKARKVHLINQNYKKHGHTHEYVHAVVEAFINGSWVVADPLYNIVYMNENGEMAGLNEIQSNPKIFKEGIRHADTKYVDYLEDLYTYAEYRKFIWNSLPWGDFIRIFLANKFGKMRVDMLSIPYILEKPYLCLAIMSYLMSLFILIQFFVINHYSTPHCQDQNGSKIR
ncbi:MAG: transglutaminase domain-containing protein [Deltaproteobacteria bacterium]|jgi:hypothetical protein|nr:transglutaminase domain-containing protein [Deltaproteobacteria bacterium]